MRPEYETKSKEDWEGNSSEIKEEEEGNNDYLNKRMAAL